MALRWGPLAGLSLAVLGAHLALGAWLSDEMSRLGGGAGASLQRLDVAFVQELQASEPPVVAVPPAPAVTAARNATRAPQVAAAASAASAPGESALPPPPPPVEPPTQDTPATALADAPLRAEAAEAAEAAEPSAPPASSAGLALAEPAAAATLSTQPPPSVDAAAAASAPTAVAFEWPPSTRLSYHLTGDYRGPVEGSARVEWIRQGDLYQVHLDVSVGVVVNRRMSSEGRLTPQGLQPRLYEEVTKALFREGRRQVVRFEPDRIVLANGQVHETLPQVQDTASQFVQLTWLFTTQSHKLKPGEAVEVPLALPRRVDRWVYDVQQADEVQTPVGLIRAYHMKPRRLQAPRGELQIEAWFAPSLQYLPVRIVIRQSEGAFADLTLSRLPQQAAAAAPVTAPAGAGGGTR